MQSATKKITDRPDIKTNPANHPTTSPTVAHHVTSAFSNFATRESSSISIAMIHHPNNMLDALRYRSSFGQKFVQRLYVFVFAP
jgi:hypothetical protein